MKTKLSETSRRIELGLVAVALAGCAASGAKPGATYEEIKAEMAKAAAERPKAAQPEAVSKALLPPLRMEMPKAGARPLEPKFDLVVNNAPATQVFMGIVSGTRYSMLVHPEVTGTISVNLKDVTVFEALDAIRELYGYDYKVDGTRIFIQPLTLQTRVFQVNYLTGRRQGKSELRVTSSAIQGTGVPGAPAAVTPTVTTTPGIVGQSVQSSDVTMTSSNDFWEELTRSLNAIVGSGAGRSVVVSPQTGNVVVRAMPEELKNVANYLKASQLAVERQVILEAKIIEVQLNNGYQQGINWAAFKTGPNSRFAAGQLTPGTVLTPSTTPLTPPLAPPLPPSATLIGGTTTGTPVTGTPIVANPANPGVIVSAAGAAGTLFGLAFQTSSFAALLSFLETQGTVHVLSSPRIATLNNQKAVLKVGQDELFVTNVSSTTTTGTATTTTPTITLQSFFSGIALDVTPRIDENNNVMLHIHPSVSNVEQVTKKIDLTGTLGTITVPVPRSSISETDSIVRAQDGQIVAIGGLMKQQQTEDRSQVPGLGDMPVVGPLFRQTNQQSEKRELVILLKPTVIQDDKNWAQNILESRERIQSMDPGSSYGGKSDMPGAGTEQK